MELVSYLNSEIERKRIEHLEEIELLNALFEEFCEQDLIQPTFVHGHPIEISPLTKKLTIETS